MTAEVGRSGVDILVLRQPLEDCPYMVAPEACRGAETLCVSYRPPRLGARRHAQQVTRCLQVQSGATIRRGGGPGGYHAGLPSHQEGSVGLSPLVHEIQWHDHDHRQRRGETPLAGKPRSSGRGFRLLNRKRLPFTGVEDCRLNRTSVGVTQGEQKSSRVTFPASLVSFRL